MRSLNILLKLQGGDHHEAQRLIRDVEQGRCDRRFQVSGSCARFQDLTRSMQQECSDPRGIHQ